MSHSLKLHTHLFVGSSAFSLFALLGGEVAQSDHDFLLLHVFRDFGVPVCEFVELLCSEGLVEFVGGPSLEREELEEVGRAGLFQARGELLDRLVAALGSHVGLQVDRDEGERGTVLDEVLSLY